MKNVDLKLPLGNLILITGVSGSGKSTLIHETLYPLVRKHLYKSRQEPLPFKKVKGVDQFDKVIQRVQDELGVKVIAVPFKKSKCFGGGLRCSYQPILRRKKSYEE